MRWCFLAIFVAFLFMLLSPSGRAGMDYRSAMRDFVIKISRHAKSQNKSFAIITNNGNELITQNGLADGPVATDFANAIDAMAREDLFYGYTKFDEPTPPADTAYMQSYLKVAKKNGLAVLVIDYAKTPAKVDDFYRKSASLDYVPLAHDSVNLDKIPSRPTRPFAENAHAITRLSEAKNLLLLTNPAHFSKKQDFLTTLKNTNFDLIFIDAFFGDAWLTTQDVNALKIKANGGKRPVIAYLSIGEAATHHHFWKTEWNHTHPEWLDEENKNWPGSFKVKYWHPEWQKIILGSADSYLDRIVAAGFDGAFLDIVDAFWHFENQHQSANSEAM